MQNTVAACLLLLLYHRTTEKSSPCQLSFKAKRLPLNTNQITLPRSLPRGCVHHLFLPCKSDIVRYTSSIWVILGGGSEMKIELLTFKHKYCKIILRN